MPRPLPRILKHPHPLSPPNYLPHTPLPQLLHTDLLPRFLLPQPQPLPQRHQLIEVAMRSMAQDRARATIDRPSNVTSEAEAAFEFVAVGGEEREVRVADAGLGGRDGEVGAVGGRGGDGRVGVFGDEDVFFDVGGQSWRQGPG